MWLSFNAQTFRTYILCVPDGKKFGFGFVQFNSLRNAMNAVELMNGSEILGETSPLLSEKGLGIIVPLAHVVGGNEYVIRTPVHFCCR